MQINLNFSLFGCLFLLLCSLVSCTINETESSKVAGDSGLIFPRQRNNNNPTLVDSNLFRQTMLAGHAFYRFQHGASPLTWNNERAAASERHSRTCVFRHSGDPAGENIAMGFGDVAGVVNAWGGERTLYDFFRPGFSSRTGHFTAMVWKKTTQIGCGRTNCPGRGWYVVCQYTPAGNVGRAFTENVGRQISGRPQDKFVQRAGASGASEIVSQSLGTSLSEVTTAPSPTSDFSPTLSHSPTSISDTTRPSSSSVIATSFSSFPTSTLSPLDSTPPTSLATVITNITTNTITVTHTSTPDPNVSLPSGIFLETPEVSQNEQALATLTTTGEDSQLTRLPDTRDANITTNNDEASEIHVPTGSEVRSGASKSDILVLGPGASVVLTILLGLFI